MARVVVVGAGVVGLSCAVSLAEAGHRVDVLARDLPLETTSVVAAALWYPYKALPRERVTAWGAETYAVLAGLVGTEDAGVRMLPGLEVFERPEPDPWWREAVPDLHRVAAPAPYADAWSFDAPVVDMPLYLLWLRDQLEALGGTVTRASLGGLPEPRGDEVVVDCAGLGARLLAHDADVRPVRGQVLHVAGVRLDRWTLHAAGPTYVVPRTDVVVVGGTDQEGEWSRSVDPVTTEEIWQRATDLVPELARGRVVAQRVGLRPVRSEVRVEAVGRTVHCYGHGGAGVTLSWGAAREVVDLVAGIDRSDDPGIVTAS